MPNTRAHLLTADAFSRGDRVTITVQPHDGLDSGEPFVFDVDIANAPPQAAGAQITPELPDKYDVLTCLVIDPQDSDGDEISQHITCGVAPRWWATVPPSTLASSRETMPCGARPDSRIPPATPP